MAPQLSAVDTFREALEKETRERGHIYALFECEHWLPVCVGIARRVGFDEYIKNWGIPDYGAHCRCIYEDADPPLYIAEECPMCKTRGNDVR